jgi:hypothetical protein
MSKSKSFFTDGARSGVWGALHTSQRGNTSPIVCVMAGGANSRVDKIFPQTGAAILDNLEDFVAALKEQRRVMGKVSGESAKPKAEEPDEDSGDEEIEERPHKSGKKHRKE